MSGTSAAGGWSTSGRLAGKVVLVTGAGSGIGAQICRTFADHGAVLAAADLDAASVAATVGELAAGQLAGAHTAHQVDVVDAGSVQSAVEAVLAVHGRIDVLVNCAGIARLAPAEELDDNDWHATLAVNLTGAYLMSRAAGRAMLAAGSGVIISIASQAASVALPGHVAYTASKAGLVGMTKVLALEWAGRGVRANTISPTIVLTPLGIAAWDNPRGEAMKAQIPTGRFAQPEEVAAAAVYLAGDDAEMVNGADLVIDGGFTIH